MLEQVGAYLVDKPVRSLSPLPIIGIPSLFWLHHQYPKLIV
jgi:hypothetical protein